MKLQTAALALLLTAGLAACSDEVITEPQATQAVSAAPQAARAPTTLIEDVTGTITGGSFVGAVQVTDFALQNGQLVVSGVLNGVATVGGVATNIVNQAFTTSATLTSPNQVCDILFLDLGPLFLDVLGLQVDLSQIVLDINAAPGAGNLLGNLLCAVVNLLNNPLGNIQGLLNLLDLVNNILG
jgi:hypothetical protein